MLEHLEDGEDELGRLAKHAQGMSGTFFEGALDAVHSQTIDNVVGEAEGNTLGNTEPGALVKRNAKVDVHKLAGVVVDEDVRTVPVAEADHVPDNGRHCDTARILEPHRKPRQRLQVLLGEEVAHDRVEMGHALLVGFDDRFVHVVVCLELLELTAYLISQHVVLLAVSGYRVSSWLSKWEPMVLRLA